jgi:hypothetical protein
LIPKPKSRILLDYTQIFHPGLVREEDQDAMGVAETPAGMLFVISEGVGGYAGGAEASQMITTDAADHGCEAGAGDAYDDRNSGSADDLVRDGETFSGIELRSFAHDAEDGETGDVATEVEVGHPIDGVVIAPPSGLKGVTAMA